jgi:hypothetical protein
MIKINTVAISTPSEFSVGVMDVTKKAERNAAGNLIIERLATKRKLELGYKYLSQAGMATLLTAISTTTFTVEYPDPVTGALRSGTFYAGDRNMGTIDYQASVIRWKDLKFNLVEV